MLLIPNETRPVVIGSDRVTVQMPVSPVTHSPTLGPPQLPRTVTPLTRRWAWSCTVISTLASQVEPCDCALPVRLPTCTPGALTTTPSARELLVALLSVSV